ncbi:UNVERIFIED_CONTAM: hypothetical protein RMT77_004931 [Armadillidium vulgare]
MRFNAAEIIEASLTQGDQEGRMTYKSPSKSALYESAYKERWFKLKGNLLFYFRLNDQGVVEKNEPSGVFVLENIIIGEESDLKYQYGFSITWKDESFRKHCFYPPSESLLQTWILKLKKASYDNLRADLLYLRYRIHQKTGKDPLQDLGTPLPVRSLRGVLVAPSKATSFKSYLSVAPSSSESALSTSDIRISVRPLSDINPIKSAPTTPSSMPKFEAPSPLPHPPPRPNRDKKRFNGRNGKYSVNKAPNDSTFKSHLEPKSSSSSQSSGSFKSHVQLSKEEIDEFLKS